MEWNAKHVLIFFFCIIGNKWSWFKYYLFPLRYFKGYLIHEYMYFNTWIHVSQHMNTCMKCSILRTGKNFALVQETHFLVWFNKALFIIFSITKYINNQLQLNILSEHKTYALSCKCQIKASFIYALIHVIVPDYYL